ncbi:MAG: hypothetical protein AAF941_10070 [Pseudomonadota bacterium]
MNEAPVRDPWSHTANQVAQSAQKLLPLAYGLCIALAAFVGWEEIGEPFVSAASSGGYYTFAEARSHAAANLIAALPVFPMIWGLVEVSLFLRQLAQGMLWSPSCMSGIGRLGAAIIVAGLIAAIVQPWLMKPDAFDLGPRSSDVAIVGLGIGLILLARLLTSLVKAANELRAESQSFV